MTVAACVATAGSRYMFLLQCDNLPVLIRAGSPLYLKVISPNVQSNFCLCWFIQGLTHRLVMFDEDLDVCFRANC